MTKVIVNSGNKEPTLVTVEGMYPGFWYKCVETPNGSYVDEICIATAVAMNQCRAVFTDGTFCSNTLFKFVHIGNVQINYTE